MKTFLSILCVSSIGLLFVLCADLPDTKTQLIVKESTQEIKS
jgi:hypothetical protein